jgi:hypothetical protein
VNTCCLEIILIGVGKDLPSISPPWGQSEQWKKNKQLFNHPVITYTSNPRLGCNTSDALASFFNCFYCT